MTTTPQSNEPENLRQRLLDLIVKMPKEEQEDYKAVLDEMGDSDIQEGYGLLKSQLEFILEL
jgi:hypothetical protein